MKTKEIVQLVIALIVFSAAGYIVYLQLVPQKGGSKSKDVTYEKVTPINPTFDPSALSVLTNSTKSRDFYSPPDLKSGLGNSQPFGPLK